MEEEAAMEAAGTNKNKKTASFFLDPLKSASVLVNTTKHLIHANLPKIVIIVPHFIPHPSLLTLQTLQFCSLLIYQLV